MALVGIKGGMRHGNASCTVARLWASAKLTDGQYALFYD